MEESFRADLHCHSTFSDGTCTPTQLIDIAVEQKLNGLSITDHDTIDAYAEAIPYAQSKQFPLISGVEFSASHRQKSVHILAYAFSLKSPLITEFCLKHHQRRLDRLQAMLERLASHQIFLEPADFSDSTPTHSIGRPHIAQALIKKNYVSSIQEAFQLYLGEGKSCYVPGVTPSVEETLDLIHRAKGFAVIAHPHLVQPPSLLTDILTMNFDGIEGYYARFPAYAHERWIKIGKKKNWMITGGSDFHGDIKPYLSLGSSWISEEIFSALLDRFNTNQQENF